MTTHGVRGSSRTGDSSLLGISELVFDDCLTAHFAPESDYSWCQGQRMKLETLLWKLTWGAGPRSWPRPVYSNRLKIAASLGAEKSSTISSTLERDDHFHFHVWLCIIKNISSDYDLICQYRKTYQMMRKHKFVKMVVKMVVQSTQKKGKRDKIAILTLSSLRWIGEKSLIRMGSDRDLYMSIDNCKRFLFVSFLSNLVIKHFQILLKYGRFLQR